MGTRILRANDVAVVLRHSSTRNENITLEHDPRMMSKPLRQPRERSAPNSLEIARAASITKSTSLALG
jgi:hypothetical protein